MDKLTDKQLQERLKWSENNVRELDEITSGRVTRGAFARIAGLKMKLEAAHHALIKEQPLVAAPVVIMLMGMEDAAGDQDARQAIEGEIVRTSEDSDAQGEDPGDRDVTHLTLQPPAIVEVEGETLGSKPNVSHPESGNVDKSGEV